MRCKRRFMHGKRLRRSPIQKNLIRTVGEILGKKAINRTLITPTLGAGAGAGFGLLGAVGGLFQGYKDLAQTKDGQEIIKSARPLPGKM